jgi:hypothetical protein
VVVCGTPDIQKKIRLKLMAFDDLIVPTIDSWRPRGTSLALRANGDLLLPIYLEIDCCEPIASFRLPAQI